jgi:hypothetical protein
VTCLKVSGCIHQHCVTRTNEVQNHYLPLKWDALPRPQLHTEHNPHMLCLLLGALD